MKLEEMMARVREAEALIPPTPRGPRPGDPVLYRGGEILYFDRPLPPLVWKPTYIPETEAP